MFGWFGEFWGGVVLRWFEWSRPRGGVVLVAEEGEEGALVGNLGVKAIVAMTKASLS